MAETPNILIYPEMGEVLNDLSDAQAGQIFRAIFDYAQGKEPAFTDPLVKMAFTPFKVIIDRDRVKYAKKCDTLRENGKKGGRPKKQQVAEEPDALSETKETTCFSENQENQMVSSKPKNHNTIQNNTIQNNTIQSSPYSPPIDERSLEFEELRLWWSDVVRPEGETAGWIEYKALKAARDRSGHSAWPGINRIRDDIERRIATPCWGSPNYYPGLAKYLRERMWTAPIKAIEQPMSWDERESKKNREAFLRLVEQEEQANGY